MILRDRVRMLEGFNGPRMNFNEVGDSKETFQFWPQVAHRYFKVLTSDVSQPNPDDFWRRPVDHQAIKEVGIPSENHQIAFPRDFPKLMVRRPLAVVLGVGASDRKLGCERRRKVLVNEQPDHDARLMVLCAALSLRA